MNIEAILKAQHERIGEAILRLDAKFVALLYNADRDRFVGLDESAALKLKFRKMTGMMVLPTPPEPGTLRTMWVFILFNGDFRWVRMHVYPEPARCSNKA